MDASDEDVTSLYGGKVMEEIRPYANSFGAYDYPGVFFLKSLQKKVIGIEYRIGDGRIKYPEHLQTIVLPEAFFYSIEIDNENDISMKSIREIFRKIAEDDDAHRVYSDFSIQPDPELISVFPSENKVRILYQLQLERDGAACIIKDDIKSLGTQWLYQMAFHDSVTGHYNWNHLVAFLEMPMDDHIQEYAFAHFDVKEFRVINEVYGHIAANKVLSNIVQAMNDAEFVLASARCHNDNFAMILRDMPEEETLQKLEEFFEKLSRLEEDPNYRIYYRCGVVPMQRAMLSGNRVADAGKMAQALGTNPNKTDITVYTDKMHDDVTWGNYIKAYLETAIENDEFVVYLQPKFDISSEKIKGAEALIRWNYKGKEFLPPYRFIPFFEKDGTIGKVDDIVLKKVCEAFAKWKGEGKPLYPISVNLSRSRMYDANIIGHLTGIIDSYGISHDLIDFEITESATYDDMDHMISILNGLRDKGFKISMDDFGTGYSSFSMLTQMPLDTLKIDKSFVDKLGTYNDRAEDIAVIRHIVTLAKELGFVCLAEGAEDKNQVDKLKSLGCEIVQGYYYSRPIPVSEYESKYL